MSMPFYVAPEQVMKDRADYARKGIARGRSLAAVVYDDGILICAENPSAHAAQGQRDLRPHRLRRRRQVQRVRPAAHRRRPPRRPQGLLVQPRGRRRPQPGQPVRPDPRPGLHPRDEADGGRDPRGRGGRRTEADDQLFHILYDGTVMDEDGFTVLGGEAEAIAARLEEAWTDSLDLPGALNVAVAALAGPDRTLAPASSRSPCSARTNGRRAFRRVDRSELASILPDGPAARPRHRAGTRAVSPPRAATTTDARSSRRRVRG